MKNDPPKTQRCTCPSGDGSLRWPCPTHPAEAQAVAWQFQDREGKWHGFTDERHRQNTIADGSWPVRALYTAPPSAPAGVSPPSSVVWHPIETAPKDNKHPLYLAQFDHDTGELIELDWDAAWEAESESWEIPQVYYIWRSANDRVGEPTHWAYQNASIQQPAADRLAESLSHARENAAYLGTGEVVLQLDGAEWMTKAEEALAQQPAAEPTNRAESSSKLVDAQPVGEAGTMPGTDGGFTTAVFKAADVPVGTKLYTAPPSAPVGVDELAQVIREVDGKHSLGAGALAEAILEKFPAITQKPSVAPVGSGHTHPHKKRANCHCIRCRPLERPCDCDGCRSLTTRLVSAPVGVEGFTTVRFLEGGIVQMDRADYDRITQQPAAVDGAMAGWVADGDTIPAYLIDATRNAIRLEFGNNGTDGYYKRILVRVFTALTAQQGGSDNNRQEGV